jgi:nicotinamidase-related amidase
MRTVFGKSVYETLDEVVAPEHTALVVVDVQHDFCSLGGHFHHTDKDLSATRVMLPKLIELRRQCRSAGVRVIFVKNTTLPDGLSDSPAWIYGLLKGGLRQEAYEPYTLAGTWGQQILPELEVGDDLVIEKFRSSAFLNTNLQELLRHNGIETVLIAGVVTQGCVLSTWRDACLRDFYAVVVNDCVASYSADLHAAAMSIMGRRDAVSSDELAAMWRRRSREVAHSVAAGC